MKTITELQMWVLVSVLGVVGGAAVFVARWGFLRMISIVDDIKQDLHRLSLNMATHDQRIQALHDTDNAHTTRMNDHSARLRELENVTAVLKTKIEKR